MEIELKKVTPKMAETWLKKNHASNRVIRWPTVEAIANDITNGNWKVTHQGICFDGNGNLIDGQHRLHAIVKSGKSVDILVAKNAESSITDPIDRHRTRTVAYLTGHNTKIIAACKVLKGYEDGFQYLYPMTPAETNDVYSRHIEAFDMLNGVPGKDKIFGGVLAALVWAIPISQDVINFAAQVTKGEMIKRGDPSFALRTWLGSNKNALQPWDTSMATSNCITHFLCGKTLRAVYSGESGYRFITTKRRVAKIANTPSVALVPTITKPGFNQE